MPDSKKVFGIPCAINKKLIDMLKALINCQLSKVMQSNV